MSETEMVILDNSNLSESYPGVTLPLTQSFVIDAYGQIFRQLAKRQLPDKKLLAKYDHVFAQMVVVYQGQLYYRLNNWYQLLSFTPWAKQLIPIWRKMMGVKDQQLATLNLRLNWWQKTRLTYHTFAGLVGNISQNTKLQRRFISNFAALQKQSQKKMDKKQLWQYFEQVKAKTLLDWDLTLINDLAVFIFTTLANKLSPGVGETLTVGKLASLDLLQTLAAISWQVSQNPRLLAQLSSLKTDQQVRRFLQRRHVLARQMSDYLKKYGDRSTAELKLESVTFQTQPRLLVQKILQLAAQPEKLSGLMATSLPPVKVKQNLLTRFFVTQAQKSLALRESSRLNRTRIYGLVRQIFLSMANNLVQAGVLVAENDIFYLTVSEIEALVADQPLLARQLVKRRRREYTIYGRATLPARLIFRAADLVPENLISRPALNKHQTKKTLIGEPCAAGQVTGEILVVKQASVVSDCQGKILVTATTDPGWALLLMEAKGLISERGSLVSHTAIIARELGLPMVVNVPDATKILVSGEQICLNGSTGEITKL
jgi:pyruvate,water dikinase